MSDAAGCAPLEAREENYRGGRLSPNDVRNIRKLMVWSDGEGIDPSTVSDLLDEVEWLHAELAAARRRLASPPPAR